MSRNPKERNGEKIGGGFFIFRRGKKTGRVGVRYNTRPFEHPNFESAQEEAHRLANENPGETFEVFQTTGFTVCNLDSTNQAKDGKVNAKDGVNIYRMINGVDQSVFFILPVLGHHPDNFPNFLDSFYIADEDPEKESRLSILTMSGGVYGNESKNQTIGSGLCPAL